MSRMIKRWSQWLRRVPFILREKGAVSIEFALALPIWMALLLGSSDVAYLLIVSQRVDRVAYSVTDIVTQSEVITINDLNNILLAAGELMQPFPFAERGLVVVSSVYKPAGQSAKITWQYSGGGTLSRPSQLGASGGLAVLPNGLTLNDNENVIIAEVFYDFDPLFVSANLLQEGDLYRIAIYKPRLSPLITPPT